MAITPADQLYVDLASRSRLLAKYADFWSYLQDKQNLTKAAWFDRLVAGTDLTRSESAGFDGLTTQEKVIKVSKAMLLKLFADHLEARYGLGSWFKNKVSDSTPAMTGVNFNAPLSEKKKELAIDGLTSWAKALQEALWTQHLTALAGGGRRRRPLIDKGAGWGTGGVHCAVYLDPTTPQTMAQVGGNYTATERDRRDDHSEMKWKAAHAKTFVTSLANSTVAEFHISKVCCDEWCSERFIKWRATLAPPNTFVGAYIYTYQDEQGGKHIYELQPEAIVHLGTWA